LVILALTVSSYPSEQIGHYFEAENQLAWQISLPVNNASIPQLLAGILLNYLYKSLLFLLLSALSPPFLVAIKSFYLSFGPVPLALLTLSTLEAHELAKPFLGYKRLHYYHY